ncbi:ATP-grasp domain-containing protein [Acinetobacter soli]|uniref:ATP-grasp domain-containing protein n=1 Tax=Acinetobacter soli TaxID=487316 RepID=UPI002B30317B|nr:ATP-grasp domain-containing protein [Acinetobacter soli]
MDLYTTLVNNLISQKIGPNSHFTEIKDWSYAALLKKACIKNGLEFEKIADNNFYFKKDGVYIGSNFNMLSNMISSTSVAIAKNKYLTNKILKAANVPVPLQQKFKADEFEKAKEYIAAQHNKVVVKPLDAMGGCGITVNVDKHSNLEEIWENAVKETITKPKIILVEEMLQGIDIRAVVINGKFKCAASRVPAHVVGDGVSTVAELVEQKNELRKKMPYHSVHLIKESQNLYVPKVNEIFWLNHVTNIAQGGEAFDLTDSLSYEIKALAERAVRSIPGLNTAGVDLLANSLTDVNQVRILEVNTYCNLTFNQYPYYGKGFDVFSSLIEETVNSFHGLKI